MVYTPHHTSVPVIYGYNWADHGITASDAYNEMISQLENYPSAYQVPGFGVNPVYNCHSYAWDLSNCWMYDPSAYITDGSYIGTYPIVNCKVTYTNSAYNSVLPIIHSGVVTLAGTTPSNIYVVSKWGYGGLISHTVLDCPYYQPYVLFNQTTSSISYWKINQ